MSKHKVTRESDEYVCSCGIRWGYGEDDPHNKATWKGKVIKLGNAMGLEDIFKFGKHGGQQLEDVIIDDPEYIEWCCDNSIVDFDEEVLEMISRKGIA